jgi:acetyl-CoA carboxylase carboxyltransferase component
MLDRISVTGRARLTGQPVAEIANGVFYSAR